jgi:hypothetical protein
VISSRDLLLDCNDDILEELMAVGVAAIERAKSSDWVCILTLILTFGGSVIPNSVRIGPLLVRVREYVPNPLR